MSYFPISLSQPKPASTAPPAQFHDYRQLPLTSFPSTLPPLINGYQVQLSPEEEARIYQLLMELLNPMNREQALMELSKKRELSDLALIIWNAFGIMAILLQEITLAYNLLSPEAFTPQVSNRVCNALALLQCVAGHDETRIPFMNAHVPILLYPFLNTTHKSRSFEFLRLTSLGVLGALVKADNPDVITFLLHTDVIPMCLRIMENGHELSQTVAIFIMQKIVADDAGLRYICESTNRLRVLCDVLAHMVQQLPQTNSYRYLKHVIRCYNSLSENPRGREMLRIGLPEALRDASFSEVLRDDVQTKKFLAQLLMNLSDGVVG
jgi:CCR4-NOT transcription complex subunit 9